MSNQELFRAVCEWIKENYPGHTAAELTIRTSQGARTRLTVPPSPNTPPPIVLPTPAETLTLTACERDIMEVVALASRRLTTEEVLSALQAAEMIHGDSTVVQALARLVNVKHELTNLKDKRGKGYGIAPHE